MLSVSDLRTHHMSYVCIWCTKCNFDAENFAQCITVTHTFLSMLAISKKVLLILRTITDWSDELKSANRILPLCGNYLVSIVASSMLQEFWMESSTIYSPACALKIFVFFIKWISAYAHKFYSMPGSVDSGSVSWDDCGQALTNMVMLTQHDK